MRDPREGVGPDGTIVTGARRDRVPAAFEPLLADVADEFSRSSASGLYLYGSVATGTARVGGSDVDLTAIGGSRAWAAAASARLTQRYADLCRGVEIGVAGEDDYVGQGDEAYGNRVFLRHYCVPLAGSDAVRPRIDFPADARAARGFNGDIVRCLERWRSGTAVAAKVARKTLVAAAGVVSVRDGIWTTDRATAVELWEDDGLRPLLRWADGAEVPSAAELAVVLADGGVVHAVAERFVADIGQW